MAKQPTNAAIDNRHYDVILAPHITEKSTMLSEHNAVVFKVAGSANKPQIKQAVEKLYNVKVMEVRTMNRKGKPRRAKFRMTHTSDWKRAVVVLDENSRIELF